MARFIQIGNRVVNQEHMDLIKIDGPRLHVGISTGAGIWLEGEEARAFAFWLGRHVEQYGADVLAEWADYQADQARKASPEFQAQEKILNDIPF